MPSDPGDTSRRELPPTSPIRNIGIIAHVNAGKTTLAERFLFDSGKQAWVGNVEAGTATMDWMPEEQARGISITAALTTFAWREVRVNLIDTPGHVDFTGEVERSLRVVDGAVLLLDGVRAVESQTEAAWRRAEELALPALGFVNKLDRTAADFERCVAALRGLVRRPLAITVRPIRRGGELVGLVDVVSGSVMPSQSEACVDPVMVANWRQELVAICAEVDESILADFVAGAPVSDDRVRAALRLATRRLLAVPVLGGAALFGTGTRALLDAVVDYLPGPASHDGGAFAALVFKLHVEVGSTLALVRIEGGALHAGQQVESAATGALAIVDSIWRMHAGSRERVSDADTGDVVAIDLSLPAVSGDTLRQPGSKVVLEQIHFSEPVLTISVEPHTSDGRMALEEQVRRLALEDPTLSVRSDPAAGQILVSGMGELHLDVFRSRLSELVAGPVRFGAPSAACYESVAAAARESAELRRRVGGAECQVRATVAVSPAPGIAGARVDSAGVVANAASIKSARAALESLAIGGVVTPLPAREVLIELVELECHGDGEALADVAAEAATIACRRAFVAAGRVELEPVVDFVVEAPAASFHAVLGDLRSRNAEFRAVLSEGAVARAEGRVRLEALLDYASRLRSLTRGRGTMRMQPAGFVRRAPT